MAYFSNSSEGAYFDEQCSTCPLFQLQCPVAQAQILWNYDQVGNDLAVQIMNNYVNESGKCKLRPLAFKLVAMQDFDPNQAELF